MSSKKQTTLASFFGGKSAAPKPVEKIANKAPESVPRDEQITTDSPKPEKQKRSITNGKTAKNAADTDAKILPSSQDGDKEKENMTAAASNPSEHVPSKPEKTNSPPKRKPEEALGRTTKKLRRRVIESDSDDTDVDGMEEDLVRKVVKEDPMDVTTPPVESPPAQTCPDTSLPQSKPKAKGETAATVEKLAKEENTERVKKVPKVERKVEMASIFSPPKSKAAAKPDAETSEAKESEEEETGSEDADVDADEVDEGKLEVASAKIVSKSILEPPSSSWKAGSPVPYSALCRTFEKIEATTKRLQITAYLTAFYRDVIRLSPHDLVACVYLCLNRIGPEYEGKELGIGESILIKAVAQATGRSAQSIKADMAEHGDLGTVAQASKGHQKTMFPPPPLTVAAVFKTLQEIANITGQSSQNLKIGKINKLLVACKENEPKYLIRSLEGKLRIGLAELTVLPSLAHAFVMSTADIKKMSEEKRVTVLAEAAATLKHVYNELPNYDEIIPELLEHGIKSLPDRCKLRPGVPLKPMLAHPTKSLTEVLDRFENLTFTCEYKYDGERAQIHLLEDGTVTVYSRNSENLSPKYPDIMASLPQVFKDNVKSFVLDCEAVAWDRDKQCILPFQVLSTRKRKDVQAADIQVQVCVFAFDLLFLNGQALTTKPLKYRREMLYEHFRDVPGVFSFAKHMESSHVEEIQTFLDLAVEGNCEGLMVKTLEQDASYEPSKRSRNWLKVKKDYLSGVGDTFDLVVIGAYTGKGKRTGWYGGFLLACYDDDKEEYQSICKIGTGFSEEDLATLTQSLNEHKADQPKPYYDWSDTPNLRPDVWFSPVQVWEVKAADLSISPVHKAAVGHINPNKGVSLRFPRFVRMREDKKPEQATSASQVADFYRSQSINSAANVVEDY